VSSMSNKTARKTKDKQASAARLIPSSGGRSTNVPYLQHHTTTMSTWERGCKWHIHGRVDRSVHDYSNKNLRPEEAEKPVVTSDSTSIRLGVYSDRNQMVCHTMHCFRDLGVWAPFNLTCIAINKAGLNYYPKILHAWCWSETVKQFEV
jgi:hypothetical protein